MLLSLQFPKPLMPRSTSTQTQKQYACPFPITSGRKADVSQLEPEALNYITSGCLKKNMKIARTKVKLRREGLKRQE
jgi:hypothetical protein